MWDGTSNDFKKWKEGIWNGIGNFLECDIEEAEKDLVLNDSLSLRIITSESIRVAYACSIRRTFFIAWTMKTLIAQGIEKILPIQCL